MPSKFPNTLLPVLALLYTATMWGLIWYPLRLLEEAGMRGIWTTLVIYLVSLLIGVLMSLGRFGELSRRPPWLLLLIAVSCGWTNVAFVLAIIDGNVMRVLLLFYLSPVWTVMFGIWLLREQISRGSYLILVLAMAGALAMLYDPGLGYPWPRDLADWLALSSGFAFALSNVLIRRASDISIRIKTTVSWLGVVLVALVFIVLQQAPLPSVAATVWWGAVALGIFGTFFMTLAVQYGVTHMPVHRSAIILLFELVVGAVSSLLLTDEQILPREWLGGAMIVLAAYLAAHMEMRSSSHVTGG